MHGRVVVVAGPHADRERRRVAHGPAVAVVVRSAGLHSHIIAGEHSQPQTGMEKPRAGAYVGQYVGDSAGVVGIRDSLLLALISLQDLLILIAHFQYQGLLPQDAFLRKHGVSVHQVVETHRAAAEHHRQAEFIRIVQGLQAGRLHKPNGGAQAGEIQRLDRRYVYGLRQRRADGHRPDAGTLVVLRVETLRIAFPEVRSGRHFRAAQIGRELRRDIEQDRLRRIALHERVHVYERLERGTRLTQALGDHIELPFLVRGEIIPGAHHGQDLSGARVLRDQRGVRAAIQPLVPVRAFGHHPLAELLQGPVQRGHDAQAAGAQDLFAVSLAQVILHGGNEVRRLQPAAAGRREHDRLRERLVQLLFGYAARVIRPLEHETLALDERFDVVAPGRIEAGRFRNSRQNGGLRQGQVLGRFREVGLAGAFDAVDGRAVWDGIQVKLQDLILGILPVYLDGDDKLLDLAGQRLFQVQERVPGQLLGYGGAAAQRPAGIGKVVPQGTHYAPDAERAMLIEITVLDRQGCVLERLRDLVEIHVGALLPAAYLIQKNGAGAVVYFSGFRDRRVGDLLRGGQTAGHKKEKHCQRRRADQNTPPQPPQEEPPLAAPATSRKKSAQTALQPAGPYLKELWHTFIL